MNIKPKEWWELQKFGKLRMRDPISISFSSKKKVEFICECGKSTYTNIQCVTSGNTSSCGKCNEMSAEWWESQKFGKLRLKTYKTLYTGSKRKEIFVCDCGKTKLIQICDVVIGKVTSCNKCNEMPAEWWEKKQFGRLRLKNPKVLHIKSSKKEIFVCNCGNEKLQSVRDITVGKIKSCGMCSQKVFEWFLKNKETISINPMLIIFN